MPRPSRRDLLKTAGAAGGLVLAPSAPAVVTTGQSLKVKLFQRFRFVLPEVGKHHLPGNFRLENIRMFSVDSGVFEVSGAYLIKSECRFFFVDCFRILARFDFRDSVKKRIKACSGNAETQQNEDKYFFHNGGEVVKRVQFSQEVSIF